LTIMRNFKVFQWWMFRLNRSNTNKFPNRDFTSRCYETCILCKWICNMMFRYIKWFESIKEQNWNLCNATNYKKYFCFSCLFSRRFWKTKISFQSYGYYKNYQ
jgi:hypothetical protein